MKLKLLLISLIICNVYSEGAVFSQDNKLLITTCGKTVKVWKISYMLKVKDYNRKNDPWIPRNSVPEITLKHDFDVKSATISSDNKYLVASGNNTSKVWDLSTHTELASLKLD